MALKMLNSPCTAFINNLTSHEIETKANRIPDFLHLHNEQVNLCKSLPSKPHKFELEH